MGKLLLMHAVPARSETTSRTNVYCRGGEEWVTTRPAHAAGAIPKTQLLPLGGLYVTLALSKSLSHV